MKSAHSNGTPMKTLPRLEQSLWRWVVAFGACWVMFCIMSLFRSYGVVYVAIMQTYDLTRQEASWPFSLCGAVLNCTAFIPGILSSFMSNRQIVFLGSVTGSFGIIFCFFARDLAWIMVFFGIFYGLGMGITVPPLLVLLNKYFVKYRATACGICFTGAALSSIIFPPVTDIILKEYGLRGTFLLLGGLVLNSLVGTALLREDSNKAQSQNAIKCMKYQKCLLIKTKQKEKGDLTALEDEATFINGHYSSKTSKDNEWTTKTSAETGFLRDEDNNLTGIDQEANQEEDYLELSLRIGGFSKICQRINIGFRNYISIARSLLTDGIFCITTISSTCGWMAYFTFSMVIVDYGLDQGMDKMEAVVLVSIYSATEIAGRLCTGWLSDTGLMRRKNIMWFTSLTSGLVLFGFPFCRTAVLLNLLTGLYGLLVGCFIILYSVLLADYLGVQKLAVATSLMFFFGGSLTLLRPLIVGYFRDSTGHYDNLFYILGATSVIGGAIWFLEPIIIRHRSTTKQDMKRNISVTLPT